MTADQANEIYEGLTAILRKSGLSWILEEVEAVLAEGKTEVEERQLRMDEERPTHRRRKRVLVYAQREWTDEERLALLVEATEAAVCGPAFLRADLASSLPEWPNHILEFSPGRTTLDAHEEYPEWRLRMLELARRSPEHEGFAVTLDGAVMDRAATARDLSTLLQSVREELNADLD